ncbi:LOW QUALITY PROTEIN: hypothetical protein TorRG33x02_027360 [Trema orientale]|uniref:Uncharacterized protein n=1 Tax=Trema orientale TaxID=63057 RepID=A0A2P5FUH9_TREOI|nr:LOW QUALITY PROTEIN: hypothetical protein TorRG33x02_027360 [Trema orientale]
MIRREETLQVGRTEEEIPYGFMGFAKGNGNWMLFFYGSSATNQT